MSNTPTFPHRFCAIILMCLALVGSGQAQQISAKRYSIAEAGAVGDGKTVNTKAIQALIDRVAKDGGGTIVVPAGTFMSGSIFFKQGVNLYIEKDGILKGTNDMADYPPVQTRWEGTERLWTAALVNFFDMDSPQLTGEGMIDGSGTEWPQAAGRGGARGGRRGGPATAPTTDQAQRGFARGAGPTTGQGARYGHPRLIAFQNCKNVKVSGLNFKDESSWCLFMVYCENAQAENLTIRAAHTIPSSDGIDIDSCKNVHVTGCDIDCNDDCISIKSGKDEDGRRVNRPAEDILIEKTRFAYGQGGAAMGSEVTGGIRNVEIRDCVVDGGNWSPIRFKSQPSRGGIVENITYRNIEIKNARSAFDFNMEWRMVNPLPAVEPLTKVRNVKIINVSGNITGSAGVIHGLAGSPIEGITFENCNITARTGLRIENATNVDTKGLHITVQQGDPIILRGATTQPAATGAL